MTMVEKSSRLTIYKRRLARNWETPPSMSRSPSADGNGRRVGLAVSLLDRGKIGEPSG